MDVINKYGQSAGKIWDILSNKGSLDEVKLMKVTRLGKDDFYAAIGWLARENKIIKIEDSYELGNTNLTEKIGNDAGKLWRAMETLGEIDVPHLSDFVNMTENDVYCALGWLAREDKIFGIKKKVKGFHAKFHLK
jgi:hypothetical protein